MSDTAAAPVKSEKKDTPRGAPDKFNGLTQRDLEILSCAWSAMKAQPEIDYQKLADACGMTNPRSASNAWSMIKKKLFTHVPAPSKVGEGGATPGKKRKAPAAKKTAAKDDVAAAVKDEAGGGDGDDIEAAPSPAKKPRSRAKPKPKAPAAAKVKDEDKNMDGSDGSGSDENAEDVKDTPPVKEKAMPKAKPAAKPKTTAKAKKEEAAAAAAAAAADTDEEDGPDGADPISADDEEGSVDGEI